MQNYYENNQLQFKVSICPYATSPYIQKAIWDGQHICVSDNPLEYHNHNFELNESTKKISEYDAGQSIIKHQLNVEHYSVLNMAFVKFNCYGFPHSVVQQIALHRDSAFLVSSMRYTGEKFIKVSQGLIPVEQTFYVRPQGTYRDHTRKSIDWKTSDIQRVLSRCQAACDEYAHLVLDRSAPYEHACEILPFNYRQPFTIACTVESLFHWLDQRSKKDNEREIQILAQMCIDEFKIVAPQLADWYMEKRWSKARLVP